MKHNRKFLMAMLTVVLVILAACGNSSDESSATLDNRSQNNNSTQNTNEDSIKNASKKDNNNTKNTEVNLKGEYLKKLNDTKNESEKLEATDSSTFALKKVENDRWEIWDELLNEIYGVLKEQLPPQEMDQLREEQRNWIKYRDDSALEASLKFKGGTLEHLEYVAVLSSLTEERCFELVENYMK
ncbi:lysozyme inhibitor LprI family protein [Psychrobacillus sp. NPDC096426]|uniref:lysozyme inhibitor LprI family protein n=1 Tax=Psychrobacillus sp. NPDC096426 TaxID=3364491 RepID=UPI0038231C19